MLNSNDSTRSCGNEQNIFLLTCLSPLDYSLVFIAPTPIQHLLSGEDNYFSIIWSTHKKIFFNREQVCNQRGTGVEDLPCLRLGIERKCPGFWEKCLVCVHHWITILIQNIVLRVFRKKTPTFFPVGLFFSVLYMISLSKSLYSKKPPLPRKSPGCGFCKRQFTNSLHCREK